MIMKGSRLLSIHPSSQPFYYISPPLPPPPPPNPQRIASNFKGGEVRCLNSLSLEFNLQPDDWESIAHHDLLVRLSDANDERYNPYSSEYVGHSEEGGVKVMKVMKVMKVKVKDEGEEARKEAERQKAGVEEWNQRRAEQRKKAIETMEKRQREQRTSLLPIQRELSIDQELSNSETATSSDRTSEDIVRLDLPLNPQSASFASPEVSSVVPPTPALPSSPAYYTTASFMSPLITSPQRMTPMKPGASDVQDVLGELERKYVTAKEWEKVEESYLGAGDGFVPDQGGEGEDDPGGGTTIEPPKGVQGFRAALEMIV